MQNDEVPNRRPGRPRKAAALRVVLGARYTPAEAAAVRTVAQAQGLSPAEYVRSAVIAATGRPDPQRLGAEIRAERRRDMLRVAASLSELIAILRQVTRDPDTDRRTLAGVREVLPELRELRNLVAEEAGR